MTPLAVSELIRIVNGKLLQGPTSGTATGVTVDTRNIHPQDLYVAFEGARVDGHDFVPQAIAAGASAVLVTKPIIAENETVPIILVKNALRAIQSLAKHERTHFNGPVIGVTGSNGKTTTKEMLAAVFQVKGPCLYTQGNQNNELGLPLTILQRNASHGSIVLEMGMRGFGQIRELCELAQPTAGTITNIGHSHIELLGSQEGIANAKAELLDALPPDGICVLSMDDPWLVRVANRFRGQPLWYTVHGPHAEAHAYATDIRLTNSGTEFNAHILGVKQKVCLPTFGKHNVANALTALLLGSAHGLDLRQMAQNLANLKPTSGRLNVVSGLHGRTVIDDCYNASPLSMQASIDVLAELAINRQSAAILGDMYELGEFAEEGHRLVGKHAADKHIATLITIGPAAKWIADAAKSGGILCCHHFESIEDALLSLPTLLPEESVVLVKASRGMHLETVVEKLVN